MVRQMVRGKAKRERQKRRKIRRRISNEKRI